MYETPSSPGPASGDIIIGGVVVFLIAFATAIIVFIVATTYWIKRYDKNIGHYYYFKCLLRKNYVKRQPPKTDYYNTQLMEDLSSGT